MNDTLIMQGWILRTKDGVACPLCDGYADEVDCTEEEVKSKYNCGRNYACCVAAFKCRLCQQRILCRKESPEL